MMNLKQRVEEKVLNILIKAEDIWHQEFDLPEIIWDVVSGNTIARAKIFSNQLLFRNDLLEHNPELYLNNTVPHEIAHIISYTLYKSSSAHDKKWKFVATMLGVINPKSTISGFSTIIAKTKSGVQKWYDYDCKCGTVLRFSQTRVNKIKRGYKGYGCGRCDKSIDTKRLLASI